MELARWKTRGSIVWLGLGGGDEMRFNEVKATQAAARLLRNRGGRMSYMKLIKLLYLPTAKL